MVSNLQSTDNSFEGIHWNPSCTVCFGCFSCCIDSVGFVLLCFHLQAALVGRDVSQELAKRTESSHAALRTLFRCGRVILHCRGPGGEAVLNMSGQCMVLKLSNRARGQSANTFETSSDVNVLSFSGSTCSRK